MICDLLAGGPVLHTGKWKSSETKQHPGTGGVHRAGFEPRSCPRQSSGEPTPQNKAVAPGLSSPRTSPSSSLRCASVALLLPDSYRLRKPLLKSFKQELRFVYFPLYSFHFQDSIKYCLKKLEFSSLIPCRRSDCS